MDQRPIAFTKAGALAGAKGVLPPALSSIAFGLAFGALAHDRGISLIETALMSALVFAGSAQYPAVLAWTHPPAALPILLTTFAINARHLLFGAALRSWLEGLGPLKSYGSLFFLTDANWLLAMRERAKGKWDAALLLGGGLAMCAGWTAGTVLGHVGGGALGDAERIGVGVAVPAFFVTMLVGAWRGRADLAPFGFGAVAAAIASVLLPPGWHVLVGALAGACAGTVLRGR
jgi:predicted branched-subunit amino acid permease